MKRRSSIPWVPAFLVVVGLGLAWLVYQQFVASPPEREMASDDPAGAPEVTALPATPTFSLPPASQYIAIIERPLFSQSRRPIAGEAAVETASADLGLSLQGVVLAGANRIAIFTDTSSGETVRLKRNDRFRGWQLTQVGGDGVIFSNNEQEQRLELNYEQAPPVQKRQRRRNRTTGQQPANQNQQNNGNQPENNQGTE